MTVGGVLLVVAAAGLWLYLLVALIRPDSWLDRPPRERAWSRRNRRERSRPDDWRPW